MSGQSPGMSCSLIQNCMTFSGKASCVTPAAAQARERFTQEVQALFARFGNLYSSTPSEDVGMADGPKLNLRQLEVGDSDKGF